MEADSPRNIGQLIWGVALVLVGVGLFFRVEQLMPQIAEIDQFANVTGIIRFCFYFIGIMLIGGGAKKIHAQYRRSDAENAEEE